MTDEQHPSALEEHQHHYDPLTADRRPNKRGRRSKTVAIVITVGLHVAVFLYLATATFKSEIKEFYDQALRVELQKKAAPPPEPPKPKVTPPPPPPANLPPPPPVNLPPPPPVNLPPPPKMELPPPPPAPPPVKHIPVITKPDWSKKPDASDMDRYYPDRAQRMNQGGTVRMSCSVTDKGTLTDCSVESEVPTDFGFGDAALKLARLFKMRPMTADGQPVGGQLVVIPIKFVPGGD